MNEVESVPEMLSLPVKVVYVGTGGRDSRLKLADTGEPYRVPHMLEDAKGRNVAFLYRVATEEQMTTETLAQTVARAEYICEAVNKWAEAKQFLVRLEAHFASMPFQPDGLEEIRRLIAD